MSSIYISTLFCNIHNDSCLLSTFSFLSLTWISLSSFWQVGGCARRTRTRTASTRPRGADGKVTRTAAVRTKDHVIHNFRTSTWVNVVTPFFIYYYILLFIIQLIFLQYFPTPGLYNITRHCTARVLLHGCYCTDPGATRYPSNYDVLQLESIR